MQTASSFVVQRSLSKDYAVEDPESRLCGNYTYGHRDVELEALSPFFCIEFIFSDVMRLLVHAEDNPNNES